jgi:prephenate dehydrogenase
VIRRLCIVGLGLLGGSVARAVRAGGLAGSIVGVGRTRERLEVARREGVVDEVETSLDRGVGGADFVLMATPVSTLAALLPAVWRAADGLAVVTDVGSTKARIARTADALAERRPLRFVGSHPMAGSEKAGYPASRADLFQGATVIVTPGERSEAATAKRVSEFWEALGARVVSMDPVTHDRAVAAVSHLPHLVADALVDAVLRLDPEFLAIAAGGFRDTTRIAASDPAVWREIFEDNREALAEAARAFRAALDDLERLIGAGDAPVVEAALARIKQAREGLR